MRVFNSNFYSVSFEQTWRWYGLSDSISLWDIKQAGLPVQSMRYTVNKIAQG